jgi:hypothetical protein
MAGSSQHSRLTVLSLSPCADEKHKQKLDTERDVQLSIILGTLDVQHIGQGGIPHEMVYPVPALQVLRAMQMKRSISPIPASCTQNGTKGAGTEGDDMVHNTILHLTSELVYCQEPLIPDSLALTEKYLTRLGGPYRKH